MRRGEKRGEGGKVQTAEGERAERVREGRRERERGGGGRERDCPP